MSLFHPRVVKKHINKMPPMDISHSGILTAWADNLTKGIYDSETQNDGEFIQQILINVLGYVGSSEGESWSIAKNQPINQLNVDVALGEFSADSVKIIAPFELKGAKTKDLDAIMAGRGKTPVQQAWEYANEIHGGSCQWVIVSNYREIRLYAFGYGKKNYESFDLSQLNDPQEYKRFIMLLSAENLLSGKTLTFLKESEQVDKDITNQLYSDYKSLRANLIKTLKQDNPDKNSLDIIKYTQTILDRVLFVAFAEDKGLLPDNTLKNAYETQNNFNPQPIWDNFKGLFHAIDKGNSTLKIPHYNGGLFAENAELDNLSISDALCEGFKKIGDYDFDSDVSVNILGHIFEQSISDLEELKAHADNIDAIEPKLDKKLSKRKKDGIFYTPAYITRYIVEQAVGGWLNDRRAELGFDKLPEITDEEFELYNINIKSKNFTQKITQKFKTKRQQVARKVNKHIEFWEAYKESLSNIKVLDPACGSGAFLNEVFDYLKTAGEAVNTELAILKGEQTALFRWDTHILANNIYGVDLNNESVEITKLSLWLKTANRQEKLTYLENNIKCGNSLIDGADVAGESAFNWNKEFSEIMESGGFDVIVGNPPYVQLSKIPSTTEEEKQYFINRYETSGGRLNTFIFFIHLGSINLNKNGYMSYIIPNTILTQNYYLDTRKLLVDDGHLKEIITYPKLPFADAVVENITFIFKKEKSKSDIQISSQSTSKTSKIGMIERQDIAEKNSYLFDIRNDPICKKIDKSKGIELTKLMNINQAIALKGDKTLSVKTEAKPSYYKLIDGRHINRYSLEWAGDYLDYNLERIHSCKRKDIFEIQEKLFFRRVSSSLVFTYDDEQYFGLNTLVVVTPKKENIPPLKYFLALLNSKLINHYYANKYKSTKKVFSEIQARSVGKIPILLPDAQKENEFIIHADSIISSTKTLKSLQYKFIDLFKSEFNLEKISRKLENWYELEFSDFVKEIEKSIKPQKLSLPQKAEWMTHFEAEKAKALALQSQIDQTDKEIDQMVYKLYNLTPEEIELIECSDTSI